jgi:hypothetical protein
VNDQTGMMALPKRGGIVAYLWQPPLPKEF